MSEKKNNDMVNRGDKRPNLPATLTFIGLRALDPLLQYNMLAHNAGSAVITTLGGSLLTQGPISNTGISFIDGLSLSPYRLALLSMSIGSTLKHAFWKAYIGEENMSVGAASIVGLINSVMNSANTLLFLCAATSAARRTGDGPAFSRFPGVPLVLGSTLFVTGIVTETVSELQRKAFKDKPQNKGKIYTGGLFSFARHINYTGYTLWRAGYALAAAGWTWGGIVAAWFAYDFSTSAIPVLSDYCKERYGEQFEEYKQKTPYLLMPYIY